MSVYTRVPKQLDDTAFGLFAGERGVAHLAKSQSGIQALSSLGDSILSEEKARKSVNDMSIMNQGEPPKRLRIPTMFLEGENGMERKKYLKDGGNCEGAKQSHVPVESEMKRSSPKSGKLDNQRGENFTSLSGFNFDGRSNPESPTNRNRPASKLIKDNQDLQKLFDSVRGKESQEQQPKQVGKLKLPTSFSLERSHDEMGRDGKNVHKKEHGAVPYESMINETVAMTFNDWKNDENMNKGDYASSNHYSANKDFHGRFETAFEQNSPPLNKQKTVRGNASDVKEIHKQKRNDAQNFWHIKHKQAIGINEKAGYKENMKPKNKMFVNGVNLATSSSGELYSHSMGQLYNGKLDQSDSGKCNQVMNGFDMVERGDNKILKDTMTDKDVRSSEVAQESIDGRGLKTVGKLKLPTAFACNHDRASQNTSGKQFQAIHTKGKTNESDEMEQKIIFEKQAMIGEDQNNTNNTNICKQDWDSETKALANSAEVETKVRKKNIFLERGTKDVKKEEEAVAISKVKPIGKLDINSVFSQQIETSPNEKKEESSAFSKTKAIFDQKSSKKGPRKQTGIGKLRMGSSKSERYEEIENLNPEGQVPSNMTNQMKEQLEKILQGRSDSVSSQRSSSSSSSKRNDNKEVGRLSLSSISSLETSFASPRTNEDFSARTYDDDPFNITSDYDDGEKAGNNKVNKGNLEFQLGNIFQKQNASEESAPSSAVSSLNTSLNAGEKKGGANYTNDSMEDSEDSNRRKLLIDAIKEKHSNETAAKEIAENENCTIEIDGSCLNDNAKTENLNKSHNNADFESQKHKSEEEKQRGRGRISIPNIFERQRGKENPTSISGNMRNVKLATQEGAKGANTMTQKSQKHRERDAEALVEIETSDKTNAKSNDCTSISVRTRYDTEKMNVSSSILGGQSTAGEKEVSFAKIENETNLSMDLSVKESMSHAAKRVNFHNGIGIIREDGRTENVPAKQTAAGKLSLSLIQSFEGGNSIRNRPGTPGRGHASQSKGIFDEVRKEKSQMFPILEEKTPSEGSTAAREGGISTFDEVKDDCSQVQNFQSKPTENDARANGKSGMLEPNKEVKIKEPSNRVVGKLSIPAMFK